MMESSGNRDYHCGAQSRGVDTVQTNLHFGYPGTKYDELSHERSSGHWTNYTLKTNKTSNFADEFHIYELDWQKDYLAYRIG